MTAMRMPRTPATAGKTRTLRCPLFLALNRSLSLSPTLCISALLLLLRSKLHGMIEKKKPEERNVENKKDGETRETLFFKPNNHSHINLFQKDPIGNYLQVSR
jgi:hypothetical protein